MWEVFTCGKMPYGRLKNTEVVERVQRGIILERPKACFKEVYEVNLLSRSRLRVSYTESRIYSDSDSR